MCGEKASAVTTVVVDCDVNTVLNTIFNHASPVTDTAYVINCTHGSVLYTTYPTIARVNVGDSFSVDGGGNVSFSCEFADFCG